VKSRVKYTSMSAASSNLVLCFWFGYNNA
jgi:hypothetical protein